MEDWLIVNVHVLHVNDVMVFQLTCTFPATDVLLLADCENITDGHIALRLLTEGVCCCCCVDPVGPRHNRQTIINNNKQNQ